MIGSKLRIALAVLLFLTAAAPAGAAEDGVNGSVATPDTGAAGSAGGDQAILAPEEGFIDKSAKYCASGYALGAATAMVAGLIGAGLPFTLGAITGSAAVGCGVAWIGSTAADGFFWAREKSNEVMEGLHASE
jgi:hypothetical protein